VPKSRPAANEDSNIDATFAAPASAPFAPSSCPSEVMANCEATEAAMSAATEGSGVSPVWTAPTPTVVPPTPAAEPIPPSLAPAQPFIESSGGQPKPVTMGGGPTLADCMALWEPDLHMTKQLWKTTCVRTMNGIDMPMVALGDGPVPHPHRSSHHARATREARGN
jgi:hypothetical protein